MSKRELHTSQELPESENCLELEDYEKKVSYLVLAVFGDGMLG